MIDNLIFAGIGFIGGVFVGFFIAVLIVSAKRYDNEFDEEDKVNVKKRR